MLLGAVFILPLWASVSAAAPTVAAPVEPASALDPKLCELHVWPAQDLHAVWTGWVHGGIVDGGQKGRSGYRAAPARVLSAERQIELLRAQPLDQLLGLPGHRVVIHDMPLDSTAIRTGTARHDQSAVPCYAELLLDTMVSQKDVFSGSALALVVRFRQFGASDQPVRVFGSYQLARTPHFPPSPVDDMAAAIGEVEAAYIVDIADFGKALNKPSKTRTK